MLILIVFMITSAIAFWCFSRFIHRNRAEDELEDKISAAIFELTSLLIGSFIGTIIYSLIYT